MPKGPYVTLNVYLADKEVFNQYKAETERNHDHKISEADFFHSIMEGLS